MIKRMEKEEKENTLASIHELMDELAETRHKLKEVRDHLKDVAEQNDEYRALQEELKDLTGKRQTAKRILQEDSDYQAINADYEDLKLKAKDLAEIMSHYLVTYFSETQETQITDNAGETRQVVLNAKIGKAEASFNEK